MPPQAGPFAVKGLLAIRASLLDTDGSPLCPLAEGSAWSPCPQNVTPARQATADQTTDLLCGDGSLADREIIPGVVTGDQVTLIISKQDFETVILLSGADPIFDPLFPTRVIGYMDPLPSDVAPNTVFEAWSRNRQNNAPAPSPYQFMRRVWPLVTWRLGDDAIGAEHSRVTLIGTAIPNNQIFDGPFDDYPTSLNGRYHAKWAEDFLPKSINAPYSASPSGGQIDTPACTPS